MTDNEIIKALECCGEPYNICAECPITNNIKDDCRCGEHLANYALDLINRQQTEIEKLKNEIQITKDAYIMLQTKNEIIKPEAIKEFAERLKENISDDCHIVSDEGEYVGYDCGDVIHCIDSLVKEKVNNEKGVSKTMNEIFYLFIFNDNSTYETDCAVFFKDAILEMAKNTGNSSDMFCKCLNAYKDDEIDGIIELFNHFCYDYDRISKIYIVDKKIFDSDSEE